MKVIFSQTSNNKYSFSITNEDGQIFSPVDKNYWYFGEYKESSSLKDAIREFERFAFLNPDFIKLSEIEDEQKEAIKSRVVDQFNRKVNGFIEFIDQLEHLDDKSKLPERVVMLKEQFDQFSTSVAETIKEFEGDTGDNSDIKEQGIKEIGFEEVQDPYAKDLIKVKRKIRKFYRKLKRKFGDYLKADSSYFLQKIASLEDSFKKEILLQFSEDICGSVPLKNTELDALELSDNGACLSFSSDNGKFSVRFGKNMVMSEIMPLEKLIVSHPYMSHGFYNDLWLPIFKSVGSFLVSDNHIIVPDEPVNVKIGYSNGRYLKNKFLGFDTRDGSGITAEIYISGGNSPLQKTCSFSLVSRKEDEVEGSLENQKNILLNSDMVICFGTGSKYDNIAGKINPDKIVDRNGYFDVPVTFTFDNGVEETVTIPSNNLRRYM